MSLPCAPVPVPVGRTVLPGTAAIHIACRVGRAKK